MTRSSSRRLSSRAATALLLGGLVLGGCSTTQIATQTPNPDGSISANKVANTDIDCPAMMVRSGASTWQVPQGASNTNLGYQGTLGQLARECAVLGDSMTIKVGVEGRVLVGPKGKQGNIEVPLRIALVQEGPQPKPVWTKFYAIPLNIPQGQTQMTFTHVEDDLTFAIPANKDLSSYVIYVGYDPLSAGKGSKKKAAPPVASTPKATKSAARPKAAAGAPAQPQPMTPASAQPTFAPVSPGGGGPTFAPPPAQAGGSNG